MKIKTGIGFDVHRLEEGLELWLGGVRVEHAKGCVAHSDGDVLIHAVCDALLGAAGLRDIGYHSRIRPTRLRELTVKSCWRELSG